LSRVELKVRSPFMRSRSMTATARRTEIQVGIAVILGAVILVVGIMWLGEVRLNRNWETYTVYFDEVGGLEVGDPVDVSGLELGKVGSITLEGGRVRTDLLIQAGVVLREDCTVEIRSIGLMGEKYIHILPGKTGDVLKAGSSIEGIYKAGLPEVVAGMGEVMVDMKAAAAALKQAIGSGQDNKGLGQSLANLDAMLKEIVSLLRETRADIAETAENMRQASQGLNEVIGSRKDQIKEGIERFSRAAQRFDSLTVTLRQIADSIERGEGSLGMLIKEKKLYEQLDATLENLNLLIEDIKEHPERYIKLEIF